jgi:hypothetical protein
MKGIQIENGFLDYSETEFNCPSCKKQYNDNNEKYLKRINKNKWGRTLISCTCGIKFYLVPDFKGDLITFKLDKL